MNKLQKLIVLLCFFQGIAQAQSSGKISGNLQFPTPNHEPVLISLLSAKNRSLEKTQISESDGSFTFDKIQFGDYLLSVETDKYNIFESGILQISAQQSEIKVPSVQLIVSVTQKLDEVVIQKKKPIIENKIDKTVVNVDAMIAVAGGDAMDVLEKSPGISVDENGTITFKGKSGVAVFIDDKPTYLSGADLEAYLKSLPASTLNQIELMTNPPAKYDASGGAGAINIVTKKSKAKGFNGGLSLRASQGKNTFTRNGLNLNYLNNKVRVFGNIGYAFAHPTNDLYIFRRFHNEDNSIKSNFDQNSFLETKSDIGNARAGIDYYTSEKTTIGFSISTLLKSSNKTSNVKSVFSNPFRAVDSTIVADNTEKNKFSNVGLNVNFRHDIGSKGQKLTADVDYLNYATTTNQTFHNYGYQADNSLSSQDESAGKLPSDIDIYSFKTDYSLPLKHDGTFEAGYKMSISKTDNDAKYDDIIGGNVIPNYDFSNHFKYDEVIHAAYVNFNMGYKRFTFQTGLRVENTESKGSQLGNMVKLASTFKKNYTNLFPTIYIQYKLDSIGDNQLVASYGKRINRPYYEDLNPFVSPLDRFTFYAGNPYLSPSFAHNYELSYRYKSYFSATASYGLSKDDINETIEISNGIYYYSRPGNIGKGQVYSFNINADIPFAKWLSTNVYSEVTHTSYQSRLYTENLNSSGTFWFIMATNSFKFPKDWSAELSGNYQTNSVSSQFTLGARGNLSVGLQKKILSGKASLKLAVADIFYTNLNSGTINNLRLTEASWVNKADTRYVSLTLVYSFGKTFQSKDYETSGADNEKNRVKD